jgi:hypothetical protein
VINQARRDVLVSSAGRICSGKGEKGGKGGNREESGDGSGDKPSSGGGLYDAFFNGLRGCFKQFRLIATPDSAGCNACVKALDTTGLDPAKVSEALGKASQMCAGTFVPKERG